MPGWPVDCTGIRCVPVTARSMTSRRTVDRCIGHDLPPGVTRERRAMGGRNHPWRTRGSRLSGSRRARSVATRPAMTTTRSRTCVVVAPAAVRQTGSQPERTAVPLLRRSRVPQLELEPAQLPGAGPVSAPVLARKPPREVATPGSAPAPCSPWRGAVRRLAAPVSPRSVPGARPCRNPLHPPRIPDCRSGPRQQRLPRWTPRVRHHGRGHPAAGGADGWCPPVGPHRSAVAPTSRRTVRPAGRQGAQRRPAPAAAARS